MSWSPWTHVMPLIFFSVVLARSPSHPDTQPPSLSKFHIRSYSAGPRVALIPQFLMQGQEGTQRGDPASMLLFSVALQPLFRRISRHCCIALNRWYADDGILVGPIDEVVKALKLLRDEGPASGFYVNISKCRAYWPTTTPAHLSRLLNFFPLTVCS